MRKYRNEKILKKLKTKMNSKKAKKNRNVKTLQYKEKQGDNNDDI